DPSERGRAVRTRLHHGLVRGSLPGAGTRNTQTCSRKHHRVTHRLHHGCRCHVHFIRVYSFSLFSKHTWVNKRESPSQHGSVYFYGGPRSTEGKPMEETHDETPTVIDLGDAAVLTQGSDDQSVESKQSPYD